MNLSYKAKSLESFQCFNLGKWISREAKREMIEKIYILWEFSITWWLKCYLTLNQVVRDTKMWKTLLLLIMMLDKVSPYLTKDYGTWNKCGSKAHRDFIYIQFSFLDNLSNIRQSMFDTYSLKLKQTVVSVHAFNLDLEKLVHLLELKLSDGCTQMVRFYLFINLFWYAT